MKKKNRLKEWITYVGQDRSPTESLAVFCLVSCGGWSALTFFYIISGMPSLLVLFIYLVISMSKGWLGMAFLTKLKEEVKNDRV